MTWWVLNLEAHSKYIIAVASGIVAGMGFGDNAKAALMTRGLAEISRLGEKLGADPMTFLGLGGIGDLIVTCTSTHSRNYTLGFKLGQGKTMDEAFTRNENGSRRCLYD